MEAGAGAGGRKVTLEKIDLTVQKGELLMVVGPTGCGKSSLLSAILGEMDMVGEDGVMAGHGGEGKEGGEGGGGGGGGEVRVRGAFAYSPQTYWITNASLKENILFGDFFDAARFAAVVDACALDTDIADMPAGAETEIGERGINVSGGQKARIQLARASYAGADVLLLDDPLSAVDTHVARRLMDQCITELLRGKTRILVTHQVQFLEAADRVCVMEEGRIIAIGTLQEVKAKCGDFLERVRAPETSQEDESPAADPPEGGEVGGGVLERRQSNLVRRQSSLSRQDSKKSGDNAADGGAGDLGKGEAGILKSRVCLCDLTARCATAHSVTREHIL